jgi:CheY-like chemotaxis protein
MVKCSDQDFKISLFSAPSKFIKMKMVLHGNIFLNLLLRVYSSAYSEMEDQPVYKWNTKNILVVEDDESSAFLLGTFLKDTGAHISYTTDGNEAVEFVRRHPETDLVLMDIHLPDKDGFTATREIKSFHNEVVVIAQTAYAFSMDHQEAKQAGCDDYLTKPLNMCLLLDKMDGYLS